MSTLSLPRPTIERAGPSIDWLRLTDREVLADARVHAAWGLAMAVDLQGCNPAKIRGAEAIKAFVVELCDRIGVTRFGETIVVHFGEDERICGYSMVQLIETSLVSGHFVDATDAAYLDIFSCKPYPPHAVVDFCKGFFEATSVRASLTLRE